MRYLAEMLLGCALLLGVGVPVCAQERGAPAYLPGSPEWAADLVIYEIAPKAFTSPFGPETGTFRSLQARLPYLQALGITGIWLTGHSLADPHHFYNIWTQYAVIEPDRLDPTLGTPEDFKALIDAAHRCGIKVFLDVVDHGVMESSSWVKKHPEWFRGGSWGMVDYDYFGGHADFDDWWVHLWTGYVTRYGVDGFRLDTNTPRPDLWRQIRDNAVRAGHPIVIWEEGNGTVLNVTDFSQQDHRVFEEQWQAMPLGSFEPRIGPPRLNELLAKDVAGYLAHVFGREGFYDVEVRYDDGTSVQGSTEGGGALKVRLNGLGADKASRRRSDLLDPRPDGVADVELTVGNLAPRAIESVVVTDDNGGRWTAAAGGDRYIALERTGDELRVFLATHTFGSSLLLSSHDNGWQGFPEHQNPFGAQGSRALFGYSFLLTPMLPIFMSGEEFDADYHSLPDLSPDLFGARDAGQGRWLYGAMLDWSELQQPRHRAMLEDVRRILQIRRRYGSILRAVRGDVEPNLVRAPYSSDIDVPKPYARWAGQQAIIIAANSNLYETAQLSLHVPIQSFGWLKAGRFRVTDVWNERAPRQYSARQLAHLRILIPPDKTPRGGLAVLEVQRLK